MAFIYLQNYIQRIMKAKELAELILVLPQELQELEIVSSEEGYVVDLTSPEVVYCDKEGFINWNNKGTKVIFV